MKCKKSEIDKLAKAYLIVKKYIIQKGFYNEIDWQQEIDIRDLTPKLFLEQYSWVVLATGLSDNVVSMIFPKIKFIMKYWEDLSFIADNYEKVKKELLKVFNNEKKVNAILNTTCFIYSKNFELIKKEIIKNGINYLKSFPFIGNITCYHLAKNIGLPYAKPDRHLKRISDILKFDSPHELCKTIAEYVADKIQVVDLVIWRYATLDKKYEKRIFNLFLNNEVKFVVFNNTPTKAIRERINY